MGMTRDGDVAINAMPSREAWRAVSETPATFEGERDPISRGLGQAWSI